MNTIAPSLSRTPFQEKEAFRQTVYGIIYQQRGAFDVEDIRRGVLEQTGIEITPIAIYRVLRELTEMSGSPLEFENYRYSVRR